MKKALLYTLLVVALQLSVALLVTLVLQLWFPATSPESATGLIYASIITDATLLALFLGFRWCPVSRNYIRTRPWLAIFWTSLLAVGMIIPLALLEEMIPESWRIDVTGDAIIKMLHTTEGYFTVCMLGPLMEEVVFRGAIIRALQQGLNLSPLRGGLWRGLPILISALIFAGVHFNPAQMPHAFIVGCLLGWLFVKTDSIILCFIVHWINNSAAYVAVKMFPTLPLDAPLADYFGGSTLAVWQAVICSLMIALPSLYQLNRVLKK